MDSTSAKRLTRTNRVDREVKLRRAVAGLFAPESLEGRVMLAADVMISEIMYHPASGEVGDEYVEIHNRGTTAADLEGWQFTKGINYTFHGRTLQPGEYLVVTADLARFRDNYPGVTNVLGGLWEGRLSNSGEEIELEDAGGATVDRVTYADEGDWAQRTRLANLWRTPTSVTRSGSTVTVTLPYHFYQAGDSVEVSGADQGAYNGVFRVINSTANTFSYSISESPASPATGNVRVRLKLDHGHAGWDWYQAADGWGSSLELINPTLGNDDGQNWGASTGAGTPGNANSVASSNVAPMILDARHFPVVPRPSEPVTITARLEDEAVTGLSAMLHWRRDGDSSFSAIQMADDGQHGDGIANDGVWGASVPAQADGTVVQFYITASDAGGYTRTWPAPAIEDETGTPAADGAYPMYQVDSNPYSGSQPLFKLIMTEAERLELADIGSFPGDGIAEDESNAAMNGTFISIDPTGTQVRYLVGIRNRGAGSRDLQPNNYRVSFPSDRTWKGTTDININARYSMEEVAGSALFRQSGLPAQDVQPVQVRVNNADLALDGPAPMGADMFGAYAWVEAENDAFVSNHFPTDDGGNYYRGVRRYTTNQPQADLSYRGEDENLYRLDYIKQTNGEQDDYTDIIDLSRAFDRAQTPEDAAFAAAVAQEINVTQWLRYFAATSLIGDNETTLGTGYGDDYALYRGIDDPRFQLIVHDLDTILGRGDNIGTATRSIFLAGATPAIDRLLKSPTFAPLYYAQLLDLLNTTFDPANLKSTLTNALGGYVPASVINSMQTFATQRKAYVLSQIPRTLTAAAPGLVAQNGYLRTTGVTVDLTGTADAVGTRSVVVNGRPANWVAWQGTWALEGVALEPGINRIVVRSLDENGEQLSRTTLDVWREVAPGTVGGTLPSGTTTWSAAAGPYRVTSNLTVPAGSTLVIEPGTTVYFNPGVRVSVLGRVVAEGTPEKRIRLTRMPGTTGGWNGFVFDYPTTLPTAQRPDNRFAYADFEHSDGGDEAIFTDKANLYLDNVVWTNHTKQYLDLNDSSITLTNSNFPGISTAELVHYWGFPTDGYALFEGNTFGLTSGYNDIIDFTGGQRPGPVAQFLNNTFLGGSDDGLDLDAADAHIEGNVFMHFHQDAARDSKSHAVSTGTEMNQLSNITVVRNYFYDVDHAILIKDGAYGTIVNNTIVNVHKIHADATTAAINLYEPRTGQWPGEGVYLEGNIFQNVSAMFENPVTPGYTTTITVNNSIYPLIAGEPVWPGTGNYHGDPHLLNPTNPTDLRRDFQLRPGAGPARGTGYNGTDRGAAIPGGASIAGEPIGTTTNTSATLTVGGPDIYAYRYRVNGGEWSDEVAVANVSHPNHVIPPIRLTGLADGEYTVRVIAKNSAGFWQSESAATVSRTWTVDSTATPSVRINEVIADNTAIPVNGRNRDMIELYNHGQNPVSLLGMSISDNPASPRKYVFGDITIQPGAYLVIYADNNDGSPGVHTGWSLREDGESVHLYNTVANGGGEVDSVVFGSQLENLSVGRVKGTWQLTTPTFGAANVERPTGDPTRLKINEWLASGRDPFNDDYVELYNPDDLPVDIGGFRLSDEPDGWPDRHVVTPLTFVPAGKYFVFTADGDPEQGADHADFKLADEQGLIALFDRTGRQIDRVLYGTQRTGVSQGRSPDGSNDFAFFTQPNPGASNPSTSQQPTTRVLDLFPFSATWRYFQTGAPAAQGSLTWKDGAYSDGAWPQGAGLLYVESSSLPQTKRTTLMLGRTTYYFRRHFNLAVDPSTITSLQLRTVLDDGAVIYVNGHEVRRIGMPEFPAVITDWTAATRNVDNATTETVSLVDAIQYLLPGDNVIAVEVHQSDPASTDIVWGAELKATQTVNNSLPSSVPLRITEINYNPPGGGLLGGSDDYEFIELMNTGSGRLSLQGVRFEAGVDFTFGDFSLDPGARAVIVKNRDAFIGRYGPGIPIVGEYGDSLDNGGGQIRLVDINGLVIHDFNYSELWQPSTDGGGHTLTLKDPAATGDVATWADAGSWRASTFLFGLPGGDDATVSTLPGAVVVSEVMSRGSGEEGDWIELHNVTQTPVSVGGWVLSDASGNTFKYLLPEDAVIPAQGYVRLTQRDDFGNASNPRAVIPFSLDDLGGEVYLSSSLIVGVRLTGYRERATFGAADPGESFVRHVNSVGEIEHVRASAATPAGPNAAPAVGPVVIGEVMYHPGGANHEFIELRNAGNTPVPVGGWRFTDGVTFEFPQGAVVPAGGVVLVVPVAPEVCRAAYNIPQSIAIFGPYTGALENAGERLALARPGVAVNGTVPYVLVDHVRYGVVDPWPATPDGGGPSLTRTALSAYGNEPRSWEAGPVGGTPGDNDNNPSPILLDGTAGDDTFAISLNEARTHVQIRRDGTLVLNLPVGPTPPVIINGLAGDDRFVFDFVNGSVLPLIALTLAGGADADTVVIAGSAPDAALSFTGSSASVSGGTFVHGSIERIELAMPKSATLSLGAGVRAVVTAPGGIFGTNGISIDPTARLDLGSGDLVVANGDLAAITALVGAARNGAVRWQGDGIGTTAATSFTGLGVVQQGQDVLVKYAYNGDANADGRVNSDDYFRIDSAFLAQPPNPAYAQGDFNFDGRINSDDYFLIDSAFLGQGAPLAAGGGDPSSASVTPSLNATSTFAAAAAAAAVEPDAARKKTSIARRVVDAVGQVTRRRKMSRAR